MTTTTAAPPRTSRKRLGPVEDRGFHLVNYCVLALFTLSVLYPLIYVVSASVSSAAAVNSGEVWLWPVGLNVDAYRTILDSPRLITGFLNSLIYTVAGALLGTALTMLAGYALSRDDLPWRRVLTFFFLIPTLFSAGIIPTYIVVRQLGLLDSWWAIIL